MATSPGSRVSLQPRGATGQTGAQGATGVGAQGLWQPSDNQLVAANFDPAFCGSNYSISAGVIYYTRVKMAQDSTITKVGVLLRSPAPAGVANAYLGVYDAAGTRLGITADISSTLNGTSSPTLFTLSSPVATQTAGTALYVAFLVGSATTAPTVQGPAGAFGSSFVASGTSRGGSGATGQTALPTSFTPSTITSGTTYFAGLSAA